jgi:hypothetical protein
MSKEQYKKLIERELERINKRIDFKIIKGEGYAHESKRHKLLRESVRKHEESGLFGRFLSFPSL